METDAPSALQESKQRRPFGRSRSAADNDDNAMMWLPGREKEEIFPVAGQQQTTMIIGKLKDGFVGSVYRKGFAQSVMS